MHFLPDEQNASDEKEELLSSGRKFLADLLQWLEKKTKQKIPTRKENHQNPAPNTFSILIIYALQFRRSYAITVTFLLQIYVENTYHGFSLIYLAFHYQFSEQFIYIDHYALFPHHFRILFMSNSCFHFLIEPRIVFPTKTVLFLDDRMQLSDLKINSL